MKTVINYDLAIESFSAREAKLKQLHLIIVTMFRLTAKQNIYKHQSNFINTLKQLTSRTFSKTHSV